MRSDQASERVVATVLFVDIVGSTAAARDLDDAGWRKVLGGYHALVRDRVRKHGGQEVDVVGDGFFAAFDRPASAIRCAAAIVEEVQPLGVRVRVGLHTGEVERTGSAISGIAVHIGARVAGEARPGEVVVSATSRDLVRGSGLDFEELGARSLKGLDGEWRLFSLRGDRASDPASNGGIDDSGVVPEHVFVGRAREIGDLVHGLREAVSGTGRLFLVSGEPGIGKSRLAFELARHAAEEDARVLWGRCWEAGGAPPYWPWVQALRSYILETEPELLRDQIGGFGSDVGRLLPELREVLPDIPVPETVDPETARFRMFDAVTRFLKNASRARPLVILLDDVHVADTPSLLFLRFLADEVVGSRLVVVVLYRDTELARDHPLTRALGDLARAEATRRVRLAGLGERDVGRFLEARTGGTVDPRLAAALVEQTEGNPLFLIEVVRLLEADGRLDVPEELEGWRISIPEGVRAAIGRRLALLSAPCRDLLTMASVLGRDFDLASLSAVTDRSLENLLDVLGEAMEAQVVTEAAAGIGRLQFSHALVRDALYDELPPSRRLRIHREVGEALERRHGGNLDPHLAELAHHFASAATDSGDRAVDYARRAAERSVALLAYEEAVRLFRMALHALDAASADDEATRCDLLLGLGDAQARAGDVRAAKETFLWAADIARRERLPDRLAGAALGYGGRFVWEQGRDDPRLLPLLEDALEALGDAQTPLRARVMARLAGGPLMDRADRRVRAALSAEAVGLARRLDDLDTLAYVLTGRYASVWWPDNLDERLEIAGELVAAAGAAGDREREHQGRIFRCFARLEVGDVEGVDEDLTALVRLEDELGQPAQRWLGTTARASVATFEGRFDDAERLIDEAFAHGRSAAGVMPSVYRSEQRWLLRTLQGRVGEVVDDMQTVARDLAVYPVLRAELAHAYTKLGRLPEASEELEALAAKRFAALPRNDTWIAALCLLAEVCDALGEVDRGREIYDLLVPYAEQTAVVPPEACVGSVARSLGVLASLLSRWEEADRHLDAALESNRRSRGRPWTILTKLDRARALARRERPGDRERAAEIRAEAVEIARDAGMQDMVRTTGPATASAGSPGAATRPSIFRREGEYWSIAFEGRGFRMKDSKGLGYLSRMLAEPGREFHAMDLARTEPDAARKVSPAEPELRVSRLGDAGELLDARAKAEYRERLAELEEEAEEARSFGDPERVARAEAERAFLIQELSRAVGLGGRDRRAASASERARVSVTRAIRSALARIREQSASLGDHLERTISTGTFCSYNPDPRARVEWHL